MPEVMLNWLKIESGHASSLGQVYPNDVYQLFLMGFDGFQYGDVSVSDAWKAPTNCAVNGSAIECDDDPNETETLYVWDYVTFTPSQVSGVVAGGKVTFSDISSGVYVVSRKEHSFPTLFLTIP